MTSTATNPETYVEVKVAESTQSDVNKGIIRLNKQTIEQLGLDAQGGFVRICGKRETYAIAAPAHGEDEGIDVIRMDGITRRNAETGIGEFVQVEKADVQEAQKVSIAPIQQNIRLQVQGELFKHAFMGRVVQKADLIVAGGASNRRDIMLGSPLGDAFNLMGEDALGQAFFGIPELRFVVTETTPRRTPVLLTENTQLEVKPEAEDIEEEHVPDVSYEDIGGMEEEIKKVREMVELPLKHPEIFERMGIDPPKGVLMHGPPGTGKTLLAKAVASETNAHFISLNGPEIVSKYYGESEKKLREVFEEAEQQAPTIIFLDEIDAIASSREEVSGEVERRIVSQLLTLMDGLNARGDVIVIAATNRPNSIDSALRRPGRFDRELEIKVPNVQGRKTVLQIHTRNMPLHEEVDLQEISRRSHGYVGADLAAVAKEAAMIVLRKVLPELLKEDQTISKEVLEKLVVHQEDLLEALKIVRPSALREVLIENPQVPFSSIGGLATVKRKLAQSVEWPIKHPEYYQQAGIRPPRGTLLYGPPGTGKTMLAKAVATEAEANFILVNGPELLSKWVGESERAVREIFRKAKQTAPTIIFFDELDSLAPKRSSDSGNQATERIVNQLLTEINGLQDMKEVMVMAASNRPDLIDSALLRPGRFDRVIYVGVPDETARNHILKHHTEQMHLFDDVDIEALAKRTEGYVGADLESLCIEAGIQMIEESSKQPGAVTWKHFEEALKEVGPSVSEDIANAYQQFEQQFRKRRGKEMHQELTKSYLG